MTKQEILKRLKGILDELRDAKTYGWIPRDSLVSLITTLEREVWWDEVKPAGAE